MGQTGAVIAEAESLEADGRVREAIELLTEANRSEPTLAIEDHLVELRYRAFFAVRHDGPAEWPPLVPVASDPGIYEIDGASLTLDELRTGILGHGAVIVRGLIPRDAAEELAAGVDRADRAAVAWEAGESTAETRPWFRPFRAKEGARVGPARKFVRQGAGVFTADSPRMLFTVLELLRTAGFVDLVNEYLGEEAAISVKKSTLRVVPPESGTDWHQDGAFLGEGIRTCNLWLALSDCGDDAPSLDVVPRRIDHVVETGTNGAVFDWSVGPGTVENYARSGVVRPVFEAGDAMLFDELFLHRTGVGSEMTRPRYAIESWFFAASRYPTDQVPLLI